MRQIREAVTFCSHATHHQPKLSHRYTHREAEYFIISTPSATSPFTLPTQRGSSTKETDNLASNMDGLNASEQKELSQRMEKKQMKDYMTMFSDVVEKCFDDCISDFSSKSLGSREEGCVTKCFEKRMAASQRAGTRFSEIIQGTMNAGQQQNTL